MANVTKTASGKWRFQVTVNYKSHVKTFATKAEGYIWEDQLKAGKGKTPNITFGKLLEDYRDKVSINKKGERWERIRIAKFLTDKELSDVKIADLDKTVIAKWRDRRLKEVSALSVLREWALLSHCIEIAIHEWDYLKENPMKSVKKPIGEAPRDRLITQDEINRLNFALNYSDDAKLSSVTSRVGAAFNFAIETAFRAQEVCNLRWVDISGSVAKINDSKTRAGVRSVPLSTKALAIIEQCKGIDEKLVFNIKTSQLDSLFRKAKKLVAIDDLHFHDTRHEAITRLAKKLDVLELARMVGHKDLNMLLVYYNKPASDLAKKLD
jgi:integrase